MPLGIAPRQISSRRAPILRSNRSQLVFDPELDPRQVNATSIHLRLDYKFLEWDFKKGNPSSAVQHNPHIVFNRPIAFSELETTYGKMVEPGKSTRLVLGNRSSLGRMRESQCCHTSQGASKVEAR